MLYDAVAILADAEGAAQLAELPPARDFVSDAFAHCKFIGHTEAATALIEAVGLVAKVDDGFIALNGNGNGNGSASAFLGACTQLRIWERELAFA